MPRETSESNLLFYAIKNQKKRQRDWSLNQKLKYYYHKINIHLLKDELKMMIIEFCPQIILNCFNKELGHIFNNRILVLDSYMTDEKYFYLYEYLSYGFRFNIFFIYVPFVKQLYNLLDFFATSSFIFQRETFKDLDLYNLLLTVCNRDKISRNFFLVSFDVFYDTYYITQNIFYEPKNLTKENLTFFRLSEYHELSKMNMIYALNIKKKLIYDYHVFTQ